MKLNGSCTTDETIYVPHGFTLNGQGHTILVTDPAGDSFRGAVVKNSGSVAHVINLRIRAPNLSVACHSYPDYLTGIWFENARGSIKNNTIVALFQTDSGCQEGDAIVAENTGPYVNVEIANNTVLNWQKTGILVLGTVNANIHDNNIQESKNQAYLAANSVQISYGAKGKLINNEIHGNNWCCDYVATGVIIYEAAGGLIVRGNDIWGNADVGIYIEETDGALVEKNRLSELGPDGSYDVAIYNCGTNTFSNNRVTGYDDNFEDCTETLALRTGRQTTAQPRR